MTSPLPGFEFLKAPAVDRPFDSPDWAFEIKYDGVRALASSDGQRTVLSTAGRPSRMGFPLLERAIAQALGGIPAVIDGEIVCLDREGRPDYRALSRRRDRAHFIAFDLLQLNGEDLRTLPWWERKRLLEDIAGGNPWLGYARHVRERGIAFYEAACSHDLEGVVAKWMHGPYVPGATPPAWVQIRNSRYSRARRRSR
ncbi:MAG TPA: hypothetical protein DEH78_22225 [Solibacterales bacterium]|nr:hypothetical protein [Bryobacterales bacterium]